MADEAAPPVTPDGGTPPANPPAAPPIVDPVAAPPAGTIVDDGKAPDAPKPDGAPPADDWRARMAGEDEKLLGFLGRIASEKSLVESYKRLHDEVKAGKYGVKPLSEDATDEEKAAWRKAFNVPEQPDAYLENLPDALIVGDDDKPYVMKFVEAMHGKNAPKDVVDVAISTYYDILAEQDAERDQLNQQAAKAGIDALREEWGNDYRRNINVVNTYISTLPQAIQDVISGARMDDGSLVQNNHEVLRWLADQALAANPLATVVPGAGANAGQAIADEIASIKKVMRENRDAYNRDERMQARFRELLGAQEKMAS